MKILLICMVLLMSSYFPIKQDIPGLEFLRGNWKMENKETYESWRINADGSLEGESYQLKDGNQKITETLTITEHAGKVIYTATVLNQNNGEGVEFILNREIKDKLSFENLTHDFPKKIQYSRVNDSTLFVSVLGDQEKGFSYKMHRQVQN